MSHLKRAREAKARNVIERFPEYFTLPSCLTHNSCHLQAADNEDTSSKVLSLIACNDNCNAPFVPPLVDAGMVWRSSEISVYN